MAVVPFPSATDRTDGEALEALERRDYREVLVRLMQAHGDEIHAFCAGLLGSRDLADDLCQVVFIDVFQALPRYEPRASLRAWLFGIARHRCLDAVRGRRRWGALVEPASELPEAAAEGARSDEKLAAAQLGKAVEDCLQSLPPQTRALLLLRFRSQLSYEEMASTCGEKIGTLRVRVARALPLVRRCLEEKEMAP
jgi:RNA polymerase sigma factor (sigma-70 family)